MGGILPVRVRAGGIESVCLGLDRRERARIRYIKGGYCGPRARGR